MATEAAEEVIQDIEDAELIAIMNEMEAAEQFNNWCRRPYSAKNQI